MPRPSGRQNNQLRTTGFGRHYTKHAEGSVLAQFGDTIVLCNASFSPGVPRFLKGEGQGWITAEYGMLPRSTGERMQREAAKGKQSGRTQEIQRLIGRSLRAVVDMSALGENTITIDCDVIQADGGTRTTAISGACVALADALNKAQQDGRIKNNPLRYLVAAISVGIYAGEPVLDLDYAEDSSAETDMNVVMAENGQFIEVQGTAEGQTFSEEELNAMLSLAKQGIQQINSVQKMALSES